MAIDSPNHNSPSCIGGISPCNIQLQLLPRSEHGDSTLIKSGCVWIGSCQIGSDKAISSGKTIADNRWPSSMPTDSRQLASSCKHLGCQFCQSARHPALAKLQAPSWTSRSRPAPVSGPAQRKQGNHHFLARQSSLLQEQCQIVRNRSEPFLRLLAHPKNLRNCFLHPAHPPLPRAPTLPLLPQHPRHFLAIILATLQPSIPILWSGAVSVSASCCDSFGFGLSLQAASCLALHQMFQV